MSLVSIRLTSVVVLLFSGAAFLLCAAPALGQDESQMLDPRVAEDLLSAYELMEEDDPAGALEQLNELMNERGEDMKAFDRANVLQIRGSANIELENVEDALRDFREALRLDALPAEQQNRLRFNLAQLYFITERYEESLTFFEEWMSQEDVEISHSSYFMMAAAHYNLEEHREVIEPIDNAIANAPDPEKRYYDLKNSALSNLDRVPERTELLEEMVEIWPDQLSYWRQLSSLYSEQEEQRKAFSAMETAYVNGLVEDENDIILLAQYYSTFNNPHRGAQLLEKEMEAGNVERNVDHLEMLSQLWSQAREHQKSIPVLREAARLSDDGELFFRLGQALMADERNEEAEQAFENAIEQGGMDNDRLANAWLLLGNARFNQAGPGDREQRMEADEAFVNAQRFDRTNQEASNWRQYISAINETERRQAMLEEDQQQRMAEAAEERQLTACRARQLAGSSLSDRCKELLSAEDGESEQPQSDSTPEQPEQPQPDSNS